MRNCWVAWQTYVGHPGKLPKLFPKFDHFLFISHRNAGASVALPSHQYLVVVIFKVLAVPGGVKCYCSNLHFPQDVLSRPSRELLCFHLVGSAWVFCPCSFCPCWLGVLSQMVLSSVFHSWMPVCILMSSFNEKFLILRRYNLVFFFLSVFFLSLRFAYGNCTNIFL